MGYADSGRVLINDEGSKTKAHAVSLERDKGFKEYDWRKVGLTLYPRPTKNEILNGF